MDNIAFLVADELMKQSVTTIIQTYREKLAQHQFHIKVEIRSSSPTAALIKY